jgi:hypothetical protein
MSAACAFPVDRQTEWKEELERILADWSAMPEAARAAVRTVIASLLSDVDVSASEAALVQDLLARRVRAASTTRPEVSVSRFTTRRRHADSPRPLAVK